MNRLFFFLLCLMPCVGYCVEIDVYQGSTEYVISADSTNLSSVYYNPTVVVLRNQTPPAPAWGSTWPIRLEIVAADHATARAVDAGVLAMEGNPVNRIALQDYDTIFCDGHEPDNAADIACIGRSEP